MTGDAPSTAVEGAGDQDYVYYRWAGFLLRHRPGTPSTAEILKVLRWTPAPAEAVSDVSQLSDDYSAGGWCARLTPAEAARMAAGFGVSL